MTANRYYLYTSLGAEFDWSGGGVNGGESFRVEDRGYEGDGDAAR